MLAGSPRDPFLQPQTHPVRALRCVLVPPQTPVPDLQRQKPSSSRQALGSFKLQFYHLKYLFRIYVQLEQRSVTVTRQAWEAKGTVKQGPGLLPASLLRSADSEIAHPIAPSVGGRSGLGAGHLLTTASVLKGCISPRSAASAMFSMSGDPAPGPGRSGP